MFRGLEGREAIQRTKAQEAGHTVNPQGTCFPVPLPMKLRGTEGYKFLTTQVLSAGVFRLAGLADIKSKEHVFFLHRTPTRNMVQTAWRQ